MIEPSYQELQQLVKTYKELTEAQTNIIEFLDAKIRRLKNNESAIWEHIDRKIDHVKSLR